MGITQHKKIRETSKGVLFELQEATIEDIEKTMHKLVSNKAQSQSDLPVRIIKQFSYNFATLVQKVFEQLLHKQISRHFDSIFSDNHCGFRKGFNTQDCLLSLSEEWKSANEEKKVFGALLIDRKPLIVCRMDCWLQNSLHMDAT